MVVLKILAIIIIVPIVVAGQLSLILLGTVGMIVYELIKEIIRRRRKEIGSKNPN